MQIVLPGALPDLAAASELARHLPEHAPVFSRWLAMGAAQPQAFDVRQHGCTPYEGWQLEASGFRPEAGQPLSAGLGPLLSPGADGEPVWLGELVHIALGADSATLLDPSLMDVTAEESAALLAAIRPLFQEDGIEAELITPQRWRMRLPQGLAPRSASPKAVAGGRLQDWWAQDAASRPWRRLLNEIQMAWYEHPVNDALAARGAAPVNGLWLYGGGRSWPVRRTASAIHPDLEAPQRAGDWGTWLQTLSALDRDVLRPLADTDGKPLLPLELLLLGASRQVSLSLKPRTGLLKWLPAPKQNWNAWWSHPV